MPKLKDGCSFDTNKVAEEYRKVLCEFVSAAEAELSNNESVDSVEELERLVAVVETIMNQANGNLYSARQEHTLSIFEANNPGTKLKRL